MDIIQLGNQIKVLEEKYQQMDGRYEALEYEIDALKSEQDTLRCRMGQVEDDIIQLRKQLIDEIDKGVEEYTLTNAILMASQFCTKEMLIDYRCWTTYIQLKTDTVTACDGYKAVEIKCHIPKHMQNSYLPWDTINDFENHIKHDVSCRADVTELIDKNITDNRIIMNKADLKRDWLEQSALRKGRDYNIRMLHLKGLKFAFNDDYLTLALAVMPNNERITVCVPPKNIKPITIISNTVRVMVLPIMLHN